jgi:hypothetical protein
MKIQRATFFGVRGVPDLTLDLADARTGAPRGLVVVTGPSGSGKTRLIEALVAAKEAVRPYGPAIVGAPWITAGNAAKILIAFHLDDGERDFAGTPSQVLEAEVIFRPDQVTCEVEEGLRAVLGRYTHNPNIGKVEYFPAERKVPMFPPFPGLGTGEQRVLRPSKDARKYGFILPFLRTLDHDAVRRERFIEILGGLSATCRYVPDTSGEAVPRCFSSRSGAPVAASELSHGEADAVVFAATAAAIGLGHSLVFIDRPDLHADDLDHLVRGLRALGPENQLIVTGRPELASATGGAAHVVALRGA